LQAGGRRFESAHLHQTAEGPEHIENCTVGTRREGHTVDASAPRADEGRGKLRKASGSRKRALIRGSPNGGTRPPGGGHRTSKGVGVRGEPGELKHLSTPRKRKRKSIPGVAASERGRAQTCAMEKAAAVVVRGLRGRRWGFCRAFDRRTGLAEAVWKGLPEEVRAL
jgi:hypothetical protein